MLTTNEKQTILELLSDGKVYVLKDFEKAIGRKISSGELNCWKMPQDIKWFFVKAPVVVGWQKQPDGNN